MTRFSWLLILAVSSLAASARHTIEVGKAILSDADSLLFHMDELYWGEGVITSGATPIVNMEQSLSSGSAIADIRAITYEDGAPFIEGGKLYFSGTSRTGGNGAIIIALTLGTGELEFTGTINCLMDGKFWKISAPHVMYDRERKIWQVTTPCHAPDNHLLWIANAFNDIRFGISTLDFSPLDYEQPKRGDEDCQIFYDKNMRKWVMVYASTRRPDKGNGYILRLQTSQRPDGGFKDYSCQTEVSATGVTTTLIGGKRYVLSGNMPDDKGNRYSVWSYPEMKFVCDLNIDINDGAFRGWNNLTPVPEGNSTRYLMLGFDRQATSDEDNWTYGNTYFLYSKQRNTGLEFDIKDENGKVIRMASRNFTYRVEDIELLRRGSRRFAFHDLLLGKIDLEYNILSTRGNVYPSIGKADSLRYESGCLFPVSDKQEDATILSGIHHPLANYLMPLNGIADGDSRYLYIGSKEGICTARILATRKGDAIEVTFEAKGKTTVLGSITCPTKNTCKLRIFMSISNLTNKRFCFVFCHKDSIWT